MASWEFRNTEFPGYILTKFRNKEITGRDLLLFAVIAAQTKNKDDGEKIGKGCYSTNAYLADAVGCHETYVPQRLGQLRDDGVILVFTVKGRRYIELEWDRVAEERESIAGEYGVQYRLAWKKAQKLAKKRAEVLGKPKGEALGKPKGEALGKPKGEALGIPKAKIRSNIKGNKKEGGSAAAATPPCSPSPRFNLQYDGKIPPKNGCRSPKGFTAPADFCLKWHDKLQGILRSRGPAYATKSIMRHKGAESFAALLKDVKDRQQIDSVLAAYAAYADQITEPDITSIHDFCRIGIYRWLLRILRANGWLDEQPAGGAKRVVWTTVDGKTRAEIVDE